MDELSIPDRAALFVGRAVIAGLLTRAAWAVIKPAFKHIHVKISVD